MNFADVIAQLHHQLGAAASATLATSLQRYFPHPVAALGVSNDSVAQIAAEAVKRHPELGDDAWLNIAEHFARSHAFHEHFILASALVAKVAGKLADDGRLLDRLQSWLEADVSNWAQCDDLCIKPLYVYLKRQPQLLARIVTWGSSQSPWCRRASNVALVKFVGRSDHIDFGQICANCERLLPDRDVYVQKGIGWMLKVASQHEQDAVLAFLRQHASVMARPTLRYAIEKLPTELRRPFIVGKH